MRHLEPRPLEPALDIEPLVRLGAVENRLVAAHVLGDIIERLDDAQPQLLALLVLRDRDVLDVADQAEVVDTARDSPVSFFLPCLLSTVRARAKDVCDDSEGYTHNFLSTTSAPVPTILPSPSKITKM